MNFIRHRSHEWSYFVLAMYYSIAIITAAVIPTEYLDMNLLGCGVSLQVLTCLGLLAATVLALKPGTGSGQVFKTHPVNASTPTGSHGGKPFSDPELLSLHLL